MTFLPIVQRELQSRSRRAATHWSRWGVALAGCLVCIQVFSFETRFSNGTSNGQIAFASLTIMAFMLAVAAALLTADSVSFERREGTLGLLFLTDLKGHDVVWGKLAATGLAGFYALLGFAPALALPLLGGGVTGGELFRTTLAVMNVLWVALAAGLWVSSRSEIQYRAMRGALLALIALMVIPWLLSAILSKTLGAVISVASPHYPFYAGSASRYAATPIAFWWSLGLVHLEGWVLLLAASRFLGKAWRESPAAAATSAKVAARASRSRLSLRGLSPICRAAMQLRGQTAIVWTAILMRSFGWIWFQLLIHWLGPGVGAGGVSSFQGITLVTTFGSGALMAWVSARFFLEGRRTGELELLMSTPVGAQEIISGQWNALWRRLRWPFGLLLVGDLVSSGALLYYSGRVVGLFVVFALFRNLFGLVNTGLSVLAVCRVGMWFGWRARNAFSAIAWTVALVQGLPWLLSMAANLLLAFGGQQVSMGGGLPLYYVAIYLVLPVLSFGTNIFFIIWANRNLRRELRLKPTGALM